MVSSGSVLLLAALSVQLWVASIGGEGLDFAWPTRQRIAGHSLSTMLVLRGGESAGDEMESSDSAMQESGPTKRQAPCHTTRREAYQSGHGKSPYGAT